MYCKKCGNQIPNNANFCPYCGEKIDNEEVVLEEVIKESIPRKATFKESVKDLFERIFLFEGKSTRSQFNYGVLFIMLLSMVLSMVTVYPSMFDSLMAAQTYEEIVLILTDMTVSKDILNPLNLFNIAMSALYAIFLVAPVFRRMTDCKVSKKWALTWAIVFAVSQIACSCLLYCLLPTQIYDSILGVLDILGVANSCIFIYCMFVRSK